MRILIAEDDTYSSLILRLMLEKESGWEVVTAEDGFKAWEKLTAGGVFDLCIFDIMMPGMDGLQLATRMRADARFEDQPVIFCTTLNDRNTVHKAAGLSASHYITKPYMREHVIRQVRRAVANRAACSRIEPSAKVAQRLGIGEGQVAELLAGLQTDLASLAGDIIASPSLMRSAASGIRINALKGAAANLGARRLTEELAELEKAREQHAGFDWLPALQRVREENEHLRRCVGLARPAVAAI